MVNYAGKDAVEEFRLTKEQKAWYKDYKKLHKVTEMLKQGLKIEYGKLQELQKLFDQSQDVKAKMLKGAPAEPINELEGQEFGEVR